LRKLRYISVSTDVSILLYFNFCKK